MNPTDSKLMLMIIATLALAIPPEIRAASSEVIPPAANETLILIYRDNAFGHGYKHWIAVNDKTVAFVKEKRYATIRAKAGAITLNLASMGNVLDSVQLDDRPGEIVYLHWKMVDDKTDDRGWKWRKTYRAHLGNHLVYVIMGHGEKGAYLIYLKTTWGSRIIANKHYIRWYQSVSLF